MYELQDRDLLYSRGRAFSKHTGSFLKPHNPNSYNVKIIGFFIIINTTSTTGIFYFFVHYINNCNRIVEEN